MTQDTPETEAIGYFGVIIPTEDFYQGFYLLPGFDAAADTLIREASRAPLKAGNVSEVRRPSPGVAAGDQTLLGSLCGLLVELTGQRNPTGIAVAGTAIARLTGKRFFRVTGERLVDGNYTNFEELAWTLDDDGIGLPMPAPVVSVKLARRCLENTPEVRAIKARLEAKKPDETGG